MNNIPGWYEWATSLALIQMLGRGIRHENDSAVTYLIDSNLQRFFVPSSKSLPKFILDRVK